MEKEIIIESNGDIRFNNITNTDRIKKICIIVNDEIYSILTNPKTELKKVREIVNDILTSKLDYETKKETGFISDYYSRDKNVNKTIK